MDAAAVETLYSVSLSSIAVGVGMMLVCLAAGFVRRRFDGWLRSMYVFGFGVAVTSCVFLLVLFGIGMRQL